MVNITDSDYRTISVRLPRQEFIDFDKLCKGTHSAKLRELIAKEVKGGFKSKFLAGKNEVKYDKTQNTFSWLVNLDSGEKIEILNNLSDDFLKNLKKEIDQAIQERNSWVHQTHSDSVQIPSEILEEKE